MIFPIPGIVAEILLKSSQLVLAISSVIIKSDSIPLFTFVGYSFESVHL